MNQRGRVMATMRIRDLAERYAVAVDAKDVGGVARLFVSDVVVPGHGVGRDAIAAFYDQVLRRFHCSMHLVANTVVDQHDEEHASGVVYCRVHHHSTDPEHWYDHALAYFDDYAIESGQWRFRRRRVHTWYRQTVAHPHADGARVIPPSGSDGTSRGRLPDGFATFETFWQRDPRSSER